MRLCAVFVLIFSALAIVGATLSDGARSGVNTALAPDDDTESDVVAVLSGFPLKAMSAKSAPVVPPLKQIPAPVTPGSTPPAASVCGVPVAQA